MAGVDGRHVGNIPANEKHAWNAGFLDAMEAEDGETCEPDAAGFNQPLEQDRDSYPDDHPVDPELEYAKAHTFGTP